MSNTVPNQLSPSSEIPQFWYNCTPNVLTNDRHSQYRIMM